MTKPKPSRLSPFPSKTPFDRFNPGNTVEIPTLHRTDGAEGPFQDPPPDRDRIIDSIRGLAHDPRPQGVKKLTGRAGWRIRVGNYRVIYEIHDDRLLILVVSVGHRQDVYR